MTLPLGLNRAEVGGGNRDAADSSRGDTNFTAALATALHQQHRTDREPEAPSADARRADDRHRPAARSDPPRTPAEATAVVAPRDQRLDQRPDQRLDPRPDQSLDQRPDQRLDQRPDQRLDQRTDQQDASLPAAEAGAANEGTKAVQPDPRHGVRAKRAVPDAAVTAIDTGGAQVVAAQIAQQLAAVAGQSSPVATAGTESGATGMDAAAGTVAAIQPDTAAGPGVAGAGAASSPVIGEGDAAPGMVVQSGPGKPGSPPPAAIAQRSVIQAAAPLPTAGQVPPQLLNAAPADAAAAAAATPVVAAPGLDRGRPEAVPAQPIALIAGSVAGAASGGLPQSAPDTGGDAGAKGEAQHQDAPTATGVVAQLPATAPAAPMAPLPDLVAPAAPGTVPTPAAQVAMQLIPLRRVGDGVHRMTIHLHPAELGPISVIAEVRGGAIAVQIHGGTEEGRAALQASLPELRKDLVDAGYGSCSLDLQQGSARPGQGWAQFDRRPDQSSAGDRAPAESPPPEPEAPPAPRPAARITSFAVDLRV